MGRLFRILLVALSILGLSFSVVVAAPAEAQAANCGCFKKLKRCLKKPGANSAACSARYDSCSGACRDKKACIFDCRKMRKEAKQVCRKTFRETACPIRGKESKKCKARAKKERNNCLKLERKNCKKICS